MPISTKLLRFCTVIRYRVALAANKWQMMRIKKPALIVFESTIFIQHVQQYDDIKKTTVGWVDAIN
ncbi:hypothetical protein CXB77_08705 [Chromatium okenii]|uniref:Uncharacterized protein n=1 Tax=Chromatium okenii TaxID=61644 RepID=A0A2S7XQX1_9GAMM|nr:hypothetical protein CXB77_08705 [Chromatium okenii]